MFDGFNNCNSWYNNQHLILRTSRSIKTTLNYFQSNNQKIDQIFYETQVDRGPLVAGSNGSLVILDSVISNSHAGGPLSESKYGGPGHCFHTEALNSDCHQINNCLKNPYQ